MAPLPGCSGGGWTMVMKINGNKVRHIVYTNQESRKSWDFTAPYNEGLLFRAGFRI